MNAEITTESLCLSKTQAGKSNDKSNDYRDYRATIVFEKPCLQNIFCPHENEEPAFSNSFDLKTVFEKIRCGDGLVWTVALTVEIKLPFSNLSGVVSTLPKRSIVSRPYLSVFSVKRIDPFHLKNECYSF